MGPTPIEPEVVDATKAKVVKCLALARRTLAPVTDDAIVEDFALGLMAVPDAYLDRALGALMLDT